MKKTNLFTPARRLTAMAMLAAGCLSAQQNGLNNTASGTGAIELGGNLLRQTNVNLVNGTTPYNLAFNGDGLFGVGNTISASTLGGSRVLFTHDNSTTTNPLYTTLTNSYYSSNTSNAHVTGLRNDVQADAVGYILRGIHNTVKGDGYHVVGMDILSQTSTPGGAYLHFGVRSNVSGAQNNWGGQFLSSAVGVSGGVATGVEAIATSDGIAAAGIFRANGGVSNGGVFGQAINTAGAINAFNLGVTGEALGNTGTDLANIGVLGEGDDAPVAMGVAGFLGRAYQQFFPGVNAAVYGNALYSQAATPYAGYFDGDVYINGAGTINSAWTISDKRLKTDITPLINTQSLISKLHPKSFNYNQQNEFNLKLSDRKDYGIIAQELEEVMPELVREVSKPAMKDKQGNTTTEAKIYKTVNYNAFIGILIANAQEQQQQLDEQKQANESLRQELEEQKQLVSGLLKKSGASTSTGINDLNSTSAGFYMNQNEPNPFNGTTVVKYSLPAQVGSAYMAIYDLTGKQITTIALTDKSTSSVTITSEKLSAGIYIYSIVGDGKVLDSKRMIVADK